VSRFDELVGGEGLAPGEEARLRRVHELLVEAGPPPDLPPALEHPSAPRDAEIVQFPLLMRRRLAVAVIAAATLVLVGVGGGYLLGHSKAKPAAFAAARVVPMQGKGALAVLRIGARDSVGNWPMQLEVSGLPTQSDPQAYYELWLTKDGEPAVSCGSFRVNAKNTTVQLSVPYSFAHYDGWVVTAQSAHEGTPGAVVLTT
jgi:hypothetical protein